ncbi:PH domain-containing protein [Inquilinus sp. Marseille-Q2685]|uniref:PH domain-containing protein n=1 Tax=Inquilinus sp. Marseille-Q2685 TaxID=2866581 RepID=UPI001CE41D8A|nr:PH domain-containing protein [Inquilinus sp. Marseille-Q2685]
MTGMLQRSQRDARELTKGIPHDRLQALDASSPPRIIRFRKIEIYGSGGNAPVPRFESVFTIANETKSDKRIWKIKKYSRRSIQYCSKFDSFALYRCGCSGHQGAGAPDDRAAWPPPDPMLD